MLLILFGALTVPEGSPAATAGPEGIQGEVRAILHHQFDAAAPAVAGNRVLGGPLRRFYRNRDYLPAWYGSQGTIPETEVLVETLWRAGGQGLSPSDFHLDLIIARLDDAAPGKIAELDVLLSDAFLRYCRAARSGRADPRNADPDWFLNVDRIDHLSLLQSALADHNLEQILGALPPRNLAYQRQQRALSAYRRIAGEGGWPALTTTKTLRLGMSAPEVSILRRRLLASGDLGTAGSSELFDEDVTAAVRIFQKRHGLETDGIVGPRTREALNVPVEQRLRQLALNLERWRWLPRELPDRYILVNMAGFELQVREHDRPTLTMRAIVGSEYRQTPAFSAPIRYLVINPYWNVPPSIAVKDILPRVRKDPGYLRREGFRVFSDWSAGARELDPGRIDWTTVGRRLPYKLRQDPGPQNALGRIKFILPNRFNVYLHDTPHRELFHRPVRTFSSGCIRVEDPVALAHLLLRDDATWSEEAIRTAMETGRRRVVTLAEPLPVFLVYLTAWVDPDGQIQLRQDVYGRDQRLEKALAQKQSGDALTYGG